MQSLAETLLPVAYRLECAELDESWAVLQFCCEMQVNRCYRGTLLLVGEPTDPTPGSFLGRRLSVHLQRSHQERSFGGIVTRATTRVRKGEGRVIEVEFEPALALLGRGRDARVFQEQSAQGILREVLGPALKAYGSSLEMGRIARGAEPRDFCVQYQQSDLDFAQRLMHEEGINYTFEYDPKRGAEILRLFDEAGTLREAENVDHRPVFPVARETAHTHRVEHIDHFEAAHQLLDAGASQCKWEWRNTTHELCGQKASPRWPGMHVFEAAQSRSRADAISRTLKDRGCTQRAEQTRVTGHSHALGLGVALSLEVEDPEEPAHEGEFLITKILHRGQCYDLFPELDGEFEEAKSWPRYDNRFWAVSLPCQIYPGASLSERPRASTQTALVCGPESGEVHADDHGRVRLRFHWDRKGSEEEPGSAWVRVAQAWAGDGWGANFLPRVGTEVVVDFLDGDPEQPLVTGAVHNGAHQPLWSTPHNHHQSGIRTRSTGGGRGFNELRFDDLKGCEQLVVRAQRELCVEALGNKQERVGGQVQQCFEGDQITQIAGGRSLSVAGDLQEQVLGVAQWHHADACIHEVGQGGYEQRVQGDLHMQSLGSQRFCAQESLSMEAFQGGAQFSVAQALDLQAGEVTIRCGGSTVQILSSGEVRVQGGSRPVKISGSTIHLNSK